MRRSTVSRVNVVVLVLAAGSGLRLGRTGPKALVRLPAPPDGHPEGPTLLELSLRTLGLAAGAAPFVVVAPPDRLEETAALVPASAAGSLIAVVPGGATRQESVRLGLAAVPEGTEVVVCHDAARPLASAELLERVLAPVEAGRADGAIPVVASPDTVKRVRDGVVVGTIPREEVGLAQTPQAFAAPALRRAHELARRDGVEATDDAMLVERAGLRVVAVPGDPANLKVTTEADLGRVAAALAGRLAEGRAGRG